MSPEQFHDALNYLDDDLIEQTDELRQGRRVLHTRPTARQVIRWAAPAACLVLILGLAPRLVPMMESRDTVDFVEEQMQEGENRSPAEAVQDYQTINGGENPRHENIASVWETYTCGDFSLSMPENWICELESGEDGSLFFVIRPPYEEGAIWVGYSPNFGVCGTGLTTEETTIAGMRACVGTYNDNHVWSFITFPDAGEWYVVQNDGANEWWGVHGDTVMEILETLVIEEKE